MPFKSEAQRKYLWANEPEIARDWTDTYGSGIQAAQGGRIGFYRGSPHSSGRGPGPGGQSSASNRGRDPGPGPGGQSGDRGGSLGSGPHGGEWSGPSYSKPDTVTVAGPNVHGEGIGSQTFNKNLRNLQRQQQYQQGAYQRAHPFLSKVKSGLGSLGRGIGHVARNFNPVSLAFDNPAMKLLTSRYGQNDLRNLGSNQNINWNDPDQEEDIAWENVNYNPNALTRLQMERGIPEDISEDSPTDSLMDERTLMADLSTNDIRMIQKAKKHGLTTVTEIKETIGAGFNKEKPPTDEEIKGVLEGTITKPTGIFAAEGGLIGSVGGISRPKYQEGNIVGAEMEGAEMEGAEMEGAEMEGAMMQSQEVIKELYDALIAQGLSPQEAMEKIKQIIAATQAEGPQSPMMGEEFPGQEFGRAPAAFGGIMDTYTGRRKYGLGSFFKKAVKKIKKLASSKLGKLALGYLATAGMANIMQPGAAQWGSPLGKGSGWLRPSQVLSNLGSAFSSPTNIADTKGQWIRKAPPGTTGIGAEVFRKSVPKVAQDSGILPGISNKALAMIGLPSVGAGLYTAAQPPEELGGEVTAEYDDKKAWWDNYLAGLDSDYSVDPSLIKSAQGGRIGRQEGGLMNLGGMEKDYRNDGGFVPLGGEEKADDVPARLSRNEFVFTADAVRNAGGGDIDRGAEVMENVMKNLEAGGKVSEESQGQGAQEMFEVSERLSEVI